MKETWLDSSSNEEIMGVLVGTDGAASLRNTQKETPALFTQPLGGWSVPCGFHSQTTSKLVFTSDPTFHEGHSQTGESIPRLVVIGIIQET